MDEIDCLIIGGGVVGLACAKTLSETGFETIIAERNAHFGMETSSRNSEVIHAGIYYPKGSMKAQTCVAGKKALYAYAEERSLPFRNCGKLIVASRQEDVATLKDIRRRAAANGVPDLIELSRSEVLDREPELNAKAALFSPSTGIIDSHSYMLSLLGDLEDSGGAIAYKTRFLGAEWDGTRWRVQLDAGQAYELRAKWLINAGGLHADRIDALCKAGHKADAAQLHFAKGTYFSLTGSAPFSTLIYPVPEPGGLGVHLTLDLSGAARFGPNVEWLNISEPDQIDYQANPALRDQFVAAISRYWPGIEPERLQADYSGVRPKVTAEGEPAGDFMIEGPAEHGAPGLIRLLGIESPGLTASLAIAYRVKNIAEQYR